MDECDSKMNLLVSFGKKEKRKSREGEAMARQLYASSFFKTEFSRFKKDLSPIETKLAVLL